ncbi:MAG: glycoside hydrolase family 3 N-terminal domain-containing protein [Ornithinibacter sp.]
MLSATSRPRTTRRPAAITATPVVLALVLAGCAGDPAGAGTAGASASPSPSASASSSPTGASTTATPSATATPSETPSTASPSPTRDAASACVASTIDAMTPSQRLGQLLMVGFDANASLGSLDEVVRGSHVGNVIYLGGWDGAAKVTRTSEHLQGLVSGKSTGDVGLLIAADQEGGEVHQLRGEGFTRPPSAKKQATMSSAALTRAATGWARELKAAGVNVNLAPVTDTVPADIGRGNEPIGRYGRQYGADPETVERASAAFLKGMLAGGIEGTVKHFPGLGRIRRNTDFSSTGITDDVTDATDPYLQPFAAGVEAGAGLVMVGSARYSRLDPKVPAMFSAPIVTDLLRGRLGYDGVVITDDVNAEAVRSTPAPQRAVRFIDAGGDIVLTGRASSAPAMLAAVRAEAADDPAFAAKVQASVQRVVTLKDRMGLLPCSSTKP